MTPGRARRRGQPLLFLGMVLIGWMALRVALWQSPIELASPLPQPVAINSDGTGAGPAVPPEADRQIRRMDAAADNSARFVDSPVRPLPGLIPALLPARDLSRADLPGSAEPGQAWPRVGEIEPPVPGRSHVRMAVGHALLAMMGLSQVELPPAVAAYFGFVSPLESSRARRSLQAGPREAARPTTSLAAATQTASIAPSPRRWGADGWLLLREGGSTRSLVPGAPSYGRSQAGAVLRYRLAPSSRHQPQAYARASSALSAPRDAEIAGGLSARPLAAVPVRLAAELRIADTQAGTDLRPAAFAITEFPPLDLPLGAQGEAYLQGGYVGGDFATPFIDGQVRVSRPVARVGGATLLAGAGAWGGAQKGASRVDVGPSATLAFRLGAVNARLALDYRVRVAGDAEPGNGPALTLSAGF